MPDPTTTAGGANLLMNTGPHPDGSITLEEAAVLREVGERLAVDGFPPLVG